MASGPITSWQIDRQTMEIVMEFFFFFAGWGDVPKSLQIVTVDMKLKTLAL